MRTQVVSGTQEQKIQSLQHSVLFLQQQHSGTLAGLHQEIERLQQKCAVLMFQVASTQSSSDGLALHGGPSLQHSYEVEIQELRNDSAQLRGDVERKEKRIALLEGQLKSREMKYRDDIRNIERKVTELQIELEHKASNIVYLTTQMHKQKLKSREKVIDVSKVRLPSILLSPSPPQRSCYNLRRSTTSPAASVAGVIQETSSNQLISSDHVLQNSLPKINSAKFSPRYKQSISDAPRPSVGHSHVKRERDLRLATRRKPSDYEDFIDMSQSQEIVPNASMAPLPPITTRSGRQLREPVKDRARTSRRIKAAANLSGEVETIIVKNTLKSPEKNYRTLKN